MTTPKKPKKPITEIIKEPKPGKTGALPIQCAEITEGDNNKYTTVALAIAAMPYCDLHQPEQVKERIHDYFQLCADNDLKPSVTALALALGTDRRRLWEIKTDYATKQLSLPKESEDAIKKAYGILDVLWNDWMQNGKINPVSGIFIGKNQFGYKDQTEYVLTPNNPLGSDVDKTTISKKYEELPE